MTKAKKTAKNKPSNVAQSVDKHTWYYEYKGSIEIVRQVRGKDGAYIESAIFRIPWRKLMASAKRCGRKLT